MIYPKKRISKLIKAYGTQGKLANAIGLIRQTTISRANAGKGIAWPTAHTLNAFYFYRYGSGSSRVAEVALANCCALAKLHGATDTGEWIADAAGLGRSAVDRYICRLSTPRGASLAALKELGDSIKPWGGPAEKPAPEDVSPQDIPVGPAFDVQRTCKVRIPFDSVIQALKAKGIQAVPERPTLELDGAYLVMSWSE